MQSLGKVLQTLRSSQYLTACTAGSGIVDAELLANGKRYNEELQKCWQRLQMSTDADNLDFFTSSCACNLSLAASERTSFIHKPEFHTQMERFRNDYKALKYFMTFKTTPMKEVTAENFIQFNKSNANTTHLISNLFLHPAGALEKFYSKQREHKIWWMRLSANPGRYYVEPFDLEANEKNAPSGSKSITIKSNFHFGSLDMERITFVPLDEEHPEKKLNTAVIRSEVELEAAVCAMLFDGIDHRREETLLINRKLAPYQCAVACLHKGKNIDELHQLCLHINLLLSHAGLRISESNTIFTDNEKFEESLRTADKIGIPYCLLVQEQTLECGLLKLRSRDTTLEETIHISDISTYLLEIFKC